MSNSSQKLVDLALLEADKEKPQFSLRQDRPAFLCHQRRRGRAPVKWEPDDIRKFHALYFGASEAGTTPLDSAVVILTSLYALAEAFDMELISTIAHACSNVEMRLRCEPDELAESLPNLLQLADLSFSLAIMNTAGRSTGTTTLEALTRLAEVHLHYIEKVTKTAKSLEASLTLASDSLAQVKAHVSRCLLQCLVTLKRLLTMSAGDDVGGLVNQMLVRVDDFAAIVDSGLLVDFLHNLNRSATDDSRAETFCELRLFFIVALRTTAHLKESKTNTTQLLDVVASLPAFTCECINRADLLEAVLLDVEDERQFKALHGVIAKHFPHDYLKQQTTSTVSVASLFERWLIILPSACHILLLDLFSRMAQCKASTRVHQQPCACLDLSDRDYEDATSLLLKNFVAQASGTPSPTKLCFMDVARRTLRSGGVVDLLVDSIISTDFHDAISDSHQQDGFFELLTELLHKSTEPQFHNIMIVALDRFNEVLKMTLTDIWVILADSADNFYAALRRFLTLIKIVITDRGLKERFASYISKIVVDLRRLFVACTDVLHGSKTVSKANAKVAQLIACVLFILYYIEQDDRAVVEGFARMREASNDVVVLLALRKMLLEGFPLTIDDSESPSDVSDMDYGLYNVQQVIKPVAKKLDRMVLFAAQQLKLVVEHCASCTAPEFEYAVIRTFLAIRPESLMSTASVFSKESLARTFRSRLLGRRVEVDEYLEFPQKILPFDDDDSEDDPWSLLDASAATYFVLNPIHRIFISEGLTMSFWVRVRRSEETAWQHVVSIGTKDVKLCLHVKPMTGSARVSIHGPEKTVVAKTTFRRLFSNGNEWVNFFLSLHETSSEVSAQILAGNRLRILKHASLSSSSEDPFCVCMGNVVSRGSNKDVQIHLSTVLGFKGVLYRECAILLRAIGCRSLMDTLNGSVPYSFFSICSPVLIQSKHCDLPHLLNDPKIFLAKLQRGLLFSVTPRSAHSFGLSVLQKGVDSTKLSEVHGSALCLTMTMEIAVNWRCQIVVKRMQTVDHAIQTLGSTKLFVFLYAISVDKQYSPECQLEALRLLLSALKRDSTYYQYFKDHHGPALLVRILAAHSAHMTLEIFQELCGFVFDRLETTVEGELCVTPRTSVVEPLLLAGLVSYSDLWKGNRFQYWSRLVQLSSQVVCMEMLPQTFRAFNQHALGRGQLLSQLLYALLDMQQNRHLFAVPVLNTPADAKSPAVLSSVITKLAKHLLGEPYRCGEVSNLWHFTLLSHPAQDTYLDYTIRAHNDWINAGYFETGREPDAVGKSELAECLKGLLETHGKERIATLWSNSNSAIAVRNITVGVPPAPTGMQPASYSRMNSTVVADANTNDDDVLKLADLELDKQSSSSDIPAEEHWLTQVRASLLGLMGEVILNCQDQLMAVLELDIVYWQTILVLLSKQKYVKIRTLAFTVLKNFFLRCAPKYRKEFVDQQGFLLLANELRKSTVNNQIADALFSLTCGEHVILREGLDSAHLERIVFDRFKIASFHALYALLEESVNDGYLFWSACSTLHKIFTADNAPRRAMFEVGLVDTMVNVLRKLCVNQHREPYMYSLCEDFVWLCITADWSENFDTSERIEDRRSSSAKTRALRWALCQVLYAWLDAIQAAYVDQFRLSTSSGVAADAIDTQSDSSDFEILYPESQWGQSSSFVSEISRVSRRSRMLEFASSEEMSRRLQFGLKMSNAVFMFLSSPHQVTGAEENLFRQNLQLLISAWKAKPGQKTGDEWNKVLSSCREKARILLAELIAFVLFPVQAKCNQSLVPNEYDAEWALKRRFLIVRGLAAELDTNRHSLVNLLDVNLDYQYAMKIALHELVFTTRVTTFSVTEYDTEVDRMIKFLRSIQIESPLSNLTKDELNSLATDEVLLVHSYYQQRNKFVNELSARASNICDKEGSLIKFTSEKAMTLTCDIAEMQNVPRKLFIAWRKSVVNDLARASEHLRQLVRELCHPEAPFFDKASWPRGNVLDTTEDRRRERRRLRPENYRFPTHFLDEQRRKEVSDSAEAPEPLQNLLRDSQLQTAVDRIEANNQVRVSFPVKLLRTAFECRGEIVVSDKKLYFLGEHASSTQKGHFYAPVTYSWTFEQVQSIYLRHHLLKDCALELFTVTGDAFLVIFEDAEHRSTLLKQLAQMQLGHLLPVDNATQLLKATQMWRRGSVTNFEYLMILNKLAGRSFNDLMQYPVFPFILSDYASAAIDLNSPSVYRDLSKPMAVQDRRMESVYIKNYNSLQSEFAKSQEVPFSSVPFGAYHYGSHYSNTGIVAHYLVRVSPYTNVALEYQDNNFDIPDRLFNSIETTWRLSSSESTTDFKELIPEFFFLPEMFRNREGLDLGIRQSGERVNDVRLPPWCPEGNPRLFCFIHRQALESTNVTDNLHHW
ncbi:beige/BEACH domain-containing protein [Aphelenchoides avenae]|nr:beige/BEACH domain-containing protein [Aphelenchus avenae]